MMAFLPIITPEEEAQLDADLDLMTTPSSTPPHSDSDLPDGSASFSNSTDVDSPNEALHKANIEVC